MKPLRNDFAGGYGDIRWQVLIEIILNLLRGEGQLRLEMSGLCGGMDTGIRPPCAVDFDGVTRHAGQYIFQFLLNGIGGVALTLPAVVAAAVIGDGELVVFHNFPLTIRGLGFVDLVQRNRNAV